MADSSLRAVRPFAFLLVAAAWACSSSSAPQDTSSSSDATGPQTDTHSEIAGDAPIPDANFPDSMLPDQNPDTGAADATKDHLNQDIVYPPQPSTGVCGKPAHTWLPPQAVGSVVSWSEHPFSNMSAEDIEALVPEGYDYLLPIPYGVRNFKLRYTTQDRGQPVEATAIVAIPVGVPLDKPLPIVVFQHGTTGFMDDCAPSRDLQDGVLSSLALATQGYIGVSPDYIGMLGFGPPSPEGTIHPYLVGESVAIACLDAVRATMAALEDQDAAPLGDPAQVLLFGGSQGGHAAFFTELYAPYYSPELTILAAVSAVPPTNLLRHAQAGCATFGDPTGSLVAALVAMQHWYGLPQDLSTLLTNDEPFFVASELEKIMSTGCGVPEDSSYEQISSPDQIYAQPFLSNCAAGDWDEAQPWGCFLAENSVRFTSVPRISDTPFLVLFGETDTLVSTDIEREEAQLLCQAGYRLQYRECAGAGHTQAPGQAMRFFLDWMKARIEGQPLAQDDICVIHGPQPQCGPAL